MRLETHTEPGTKRRVWTLTVEPEELAGVGLSRAEWMGVAAADTTIADVLEALAMVASRLEAEEASRRADTIMNELDAQAGNAPPVNAAWPWMPPALDLRRPARCSVTEGGHRCMRDEGHGGSHEWWDVYVESQKADARERAVAAGREAATDMRAYRAFGLADEPLRPPWRDPVT